MSLASAALTLASSRAAASRLQRPRLQVEIDRLPAEVALLREELDIKDAAALSTLRSNACGSSR